MRKIFILLFFIVISKTNAQKNISIEADGNLESKNPLTCVDISQVTNQHTPADIIKGIQKCIEIKDFENAAKLFAISGVYGRYDTYRVKDKTAHQALLMLQQNAFMNIDEKTQSSMIEAVQKQLKKGSKNLDTLCQAIQQIGPPKYYPRYMIQHGIQAFTQKESNDGLVENFDSQESWNLSLKKYLHCGE